MVSLWCGWRDLNPHGRPHEPESCASAYSATSAYQIANLLYTKRKLFATIFEILSHSLLHCYRNIAKINKAVHIKVDCFLFVFNFYVRLFPHFVVQVGRFHLRTTGCFGRFWVVLRQTICQGQVPIRHRSGQGRDWTPARTRWLALTRWWGNRRWVGMFPQSAFLRS